MTDTKNKSQQAELHDLQRQHQRRQNYIQLCGIISFAGSGWLSAKGFFDVAIEGAVATTEGMVTSAMLALIAVTGLGTATLLLYSVAANSFKAQRLSVMILACALVPFIFGISTVSNIIASTGPVALVRDMRLKADSYEEYYQYASKSAASAKNAQAALAPMAESLCALAEGEGKRGAISGSGGKGAIYAAYFSSCTSLQKILEIIRESSTAENDRHDAADEILQALQNIPQDVSLSVFERQAAFRLKARELDALVSRSNVSSLPEQIAAQMDVLSASVAALDTQGGSFGKRQSNAVTGLKNTLGSVSEIIGELTQHGTEETVNPPADLLNLTSAIRAHGTNFLPQMALAILVDTLGLWFACLLIVSRRTIELHKKSA